MKPSKRKEGLAIIQEVMKTGYEFEEGTCAVVLDYGGFGRQKEYRTFLKRKGLNPNVTMESKAFAGYLIPAQRIKELRIEFLKEFYGLDKDGKASDHNFRAWTWRILIVACLAFWYWIFKLLAGN